MKKKLIALLLVVSFLSVSCFKDNDDTFTPASTLDIQNFIWRGLNFFYLYKADTPELANDAFADQTELDNFLSGYDTPESLFEYLKSSQDRFSFLVDDYVALENSLSGVSLNNGMEFGLVFYPDASGNVFGYVRYILPNTDAASQGLQRGIIFNTVDGVQIDQNNFQDLLAPDTYTIGLATFDGTTVTPTGDTVALTKTEYTENPVFISQTLTVEGQKVGYLMYNAFTANFDEDLNDAFAQFQADGIVELVLDLRYNSGGSVESSKDLSSMITGQFNGQVFFTEEWNADRQDEFASPGIFDNSIRTGAAINSLMLDRVYVLTTGRTASASELVINGLDPYINVVQVGEPTTGKFQASFLLYDAPAPSFSRSEANPDHTYAMLPLVFKTVNANGVTDVIDGLFPDVPLDEDFTNLGVLGDPTEPLLDAALDHMFGRSSTRNNVMPLEVLSESKATSLTYQIMIAEQ